ncbi:unnamed protein product, partial [Trichogramma brassicae]
MSNFTIKNLKVKLQDHKIHIEVVFPRIQLNSDYNVKAKILVPIAEKGPIELVSEQKDQRARRFNDKKMMMKFKRFFFLPPRAKIINDYLSSCRRADVYNDKYWYCTGSERRDSLGRWPQQHGACNVKLL